VRRPSAGCGRLRARRKPARPVGRDEEGRWAATGLGRVCAALTRLPGAELDDDPDDEASLIATPDSLAEPGFVLRVNLRRTGVWRRLRLPGQLTAYGLHDIIQAAFGWDGDHLHKLRAGPFTFAPAWPVLDDAIPSEMVTLTDLSTLGVRELTYTYDLGDCWQHEIIVEAMLPPGDVLEPECLAGRSVTPAEDAATGLKTKTETSARQLNQSLSGSLIPPASTAR